MAEVEVKGATRTDVAIALGLPLSKHSILEVFFQPREDLYLERHEPLARCTTFRVERRMNNETHCEAMTGAELIQAVTAFVRQQESHARAYAKQKKLERKQFLQGQLNKALAESANNSETIRELREEIRKCR